jgi:hypothetical protein
MTSLRARLPRGILSPSAAAAGVLNLTNYTVVRPSGILLVCPQTEILYKLTFSVRLHSDPERQKTGPNANLRAKESKVHLCLSFRTDQHSGNGLHVRLKGAHFFWQRPKCTSSHERKSIHWLHFKYESGPQYFNLGRTVHKCIHLISRHLWTIVKCILDITKEFHASPRVIAGKLVLAPKFHNYILHILQTLDIAKR